MGCVDSIASGLRREQKQVSATVSDDSITHENEDTGNASTML